MKTILSLGFGILAITVVVMGLYEQLSKSRDSQKQEQNLYALTESGKQPYDWAYKQMKHIFEERKNVQKRSTVKR